MSAINVSDNARNLITRAVAYLQRIAEEAASCLALRWYLAEQGARVLSVDRVSRAQLPWRFRTRYHVRGLRPQDLHSPLAVMRENVTAARETGLLYLLQPFIPPADAVVISLIARLSWMAVEAAWTAFLAGKMLSRKPG